MSERLDANKLLEFIDAMEYYEYTSPSDIDTGVAVMCQKVRSKIKSGVFNADQWISVKERLPEYTGEVIIAIVDSLGLLRVKWAYYNNENRNFSLQSGLLIEPTHWQPLPEPPEIGYRSGRCEM